ncbi:MAG: helix-turn-helix domain-containing protein [Candidatus Eremiobacteraeota bacterium]|nr:helix-turn-helix domain-containing protein [Candidatus Eremiobacteraeota bacterium]MBV8366042.1 helix-turn-helix domain-containing protein [Candidatus Eremiobacteraeota bacterium]
MTADDLAALSERAAGIVSGGGGLKALAQALADAAHGAVLIEDDQWRHLAAAQARGSGRVPASFAPWYKPAASVNGRLARATVEGLHALCAPLPVSGGNGESVPGYVTLFERAKPSTLAAAAVRIIASAAGIELARRSGGRPQARRAFWERYIAGELSDHSSLKEEAGAAGVSLPAAFLAAVFDVEGALPGSARDAVAQAIAPADGVCPLAQTSSQVVALFPMRHAADVSRARQAATNAVRDVPAQAAARSVTCGIGAYHSDILEGPRSLDEGKHALALGRRLYGRGSVTLYSDLGVYALLHAGGERDAFLDFAETQLAPLVQYDRKHKTDLVKTLRLYFDIGENVKEAAERLSVHRHTIFYRLNQIAQILKVDLRAPKDQLSLRAALAIYQMEHEDA